MKVVNVRGMKANIKGVRYVGCSIGQWIGSPLGNELRNTSKCPYCGEKHSNVNSLPCYRLWLFEKIQAGDANVLAALRSISPDAVLGCWCCNVDAGRPRSKQVCHAEIVAAAAEWLRKKDEAADNAVYTVTPAGQAVIDADRLAQVQKSVANSGRAMKPPIEPTT